ncbi:MAG: zf-HC2 domain-containing protein [Fimbriimonadales bacterium]
MRRGNCGWARRHMWRYLDKTLPAPVSRQVEAHLTVCIPCRAEFAQAQEALESLRTGKPLTSEQQRLLKRSGGAPILKRAFVVAVLALLVGVGAYLWQIPSDALFTRLTERGVAPTPASEQPNTLPAATQPMDDAGAIAKFKLEPLNIEESLRPAPPPAETPKPPAETPATPTPAPTEPPKPPAPKREAKPRTTQRKSPPARPRQNLAPKPPAEGAVEVYDEAGNLIHRNQVQEKPR